MADDLSKAISQLQQMLNSEDGAEKLNEMVSAIGGMFGAKGDQTSGEPAERSASFETSSEPLSNINLDFLLKAKNIFDNVSSQKDDRTVLLNALRPYMRAERMQKLDMIIKLVSLAKIGAAMGDMKSFL